MKAFQFVWELRNQADAGAVHTEHCLGGEWPIKGQYSGHVTYCDQSQVMLSEAVKYMEAEVEEIDQQERIDNPPREILFWSLK